MFRKIAEWFDKHLGWHRPIKQQGWDGCSFTSVCRYCGKEIMQDSQGNWF